MLAAADLVLVMSEGQRRAVATLAPEALGKTMLLGRWLEGGQGLEIPDPYRRPREVFEQVHGLLKQATAVWAKRLQRPGSPG